MLQKNKVLQCNNVNYLVTTCSKYDTLNLLNNRKAIIYVQGMAVKKIVAISVTFLLFFNLTILI